MGVAAAGMTYDDRAVLESFHAEQTLNYPLLQDIDVRHVDAFGIRNMDYEPGDTGYGIPYPGIIWIGTDGVIRGKWAVPSYADRPPFDEVLAEIRAQLDAG